MKIEDKVFMPINDNIIVNDCLDYDKVKLFLGYDIVAYRILWYTGEWSVWFVYGVNDIYQKENLNEPKRSYVACFNDHIFEVIYKI